MLPPFSTQEPTSPGFVHATGEVTPSWEVVDRGQIDLTEAWGDAGRNMAINTTHPKVGGKDRKEKGIVCIQLPDITSPSIHNVSPALLTEHCSYFPTIKPWCFESSCQASPRLLLLATSMFS